MMYRWMYIPLAMFLYSYGALAQASPASVWQQAIGMAAAGDERGAVGYLSGAVSMLPELPHNLWRERMQLAVILLEMRQHRAIVAPQMEHKPAAIWTETKLARRYLHDYPLPKQVSPVMPGVLGVLLPGAGHAWLGRWHDAGVAAMLVMPMLLLTLWAMRRGMGPVTVFFALITVWLWSGSVFSAISLAERGTAEAYGLWWQGLWQASALPGRPW